MHTRIILEFILAYTTDSVIPIFKRMPPMTFVLKNVNRKRKVYEMNVD